MGGLAPESVFGSCGGFRAFRFRSTGSYGGVSNMLQSWGLTLLARIDRWLGRIDAELANERWPSRSRIEVCVISGMAMALLYSMWALLATAFGRGSATLSDVGVSLTEVIGSYWIVGIIGGALVGLSWPLTKWKVGAGALGSVVAFLLCAGIVGVSSIKHDAGLFWFVKVGGSIAGFLTGMVIWTQEKRGG